MRAALAVLLNKTPPCPPVASHKLTLVVAGESQLGAFCHKRDTFWQKRQEVTRSVARAPTSAAGVTTSAPRATSSARSRQRISGWENRARSTSSARPAMGSRNFLGGKTDNGEGRSAHWPRTAPERGRLTNTDHDRFQGETNGPTWLTYEQAARYAGWSVGHLRNLVSAGRVPVYGIRRRRRFRRDMLDLFLTDPDMAMRRFSAEGNSSHGR